tara:strand:+ start:19 stop:768 length:750 start_codon:yes stop_codon:yes gene_type:complete
LIDIQLYNENCKETLKRLPDGSIDLMLQDTPFGITQNDWDISPNFSEMWPEWERVLKPNGVWLFFGTLPFAASLISSKLGFFRYDIVWQKSHPTGFLNAKRIPLRSHELILVFYRSLPTYNPILTPKPKKDIRPDTGNSKKSTNYGSYNLAPSRQAPTDLSYPKSIWKSNIDQNQIHPTQKPVDLIRELIMTYSNKGETVFDGYSGSGTTAIACIKEQRNFIGSEINKDYFEKSIKRIQQEKCQLVLAL